MPFYVKKPKILLLFTHPLSVFFPPPLQLVAFSNYDAATRRTGDNITLA